MVLELMVVCGKGHQDPFVIGEAQKIKSLAYL